MRKLIRSLSIGAVLALAACGPAPTVTQPTALPTIEPTVAVIEMPTAPVTTPYPAPNSSYPAPGQPTPEPTSEINEATMKAMSELARQKLAEELEISVDQIKVVTADPTYWSDTSLGCPQPGMTYPQVITPGYRVTLVVGSTLYTYHTDTKQTVVRCEL
ncbi:MAG: hypothetical protein J7454_03970 [Roseiflexus sp.]|nr:hypothetical protein [Roseiflexus sp.]